MKMKEAIDTVLILLDEQGQILDEDEKKAINKLIATSGFVERMRGIMPEKKKCSHADKCSIEQDGKKSDGKIFCSECEKNESYNQAIDDCAAAYVASMPSKENLLSLIMEINRQELIEDDVPYSSAAVRIGQAIHDLMVKGVGK